MLASTQKIHKFPVVKIYWTTTYPFYHVRVLLWQLYTKACLRYESLACFRRHVHTGYLPSSISSKSYWLFIVLELHRLGLNFASSPGCVILGRILNTL